MFFVFFLFLIILSVVFIIFKKKKDNFENSLLNIYNEPLKPCGTPIMSTGSWDRNGLCSEKGGGVHQICVKNIAKNTKQFSLKTGQSDWSDQRGKDNHCVCLGAWSLYNANDKTIRNKQVLKCSAIPKMSFSNTYVSKFSEGWNKWNGLELQNQIVDGVEALFINCYNPNDKKSENLKKNYCDFAKKTKNLNNTKLFKRICI